MMTFPQFVSKYLGKEVDFDGAYAGQCVDLFRQYIKDCLGHQQPKGVVGAADFWTNYSTDPVLNTNFTKISNSATNIPQEGDVMFWNKNAGGGYGHVAIYISGDVNGFVSFDQNWPTLSKCTKTTHNYTNVYGWLRPKKDAMATCLINNDADGQKTFENLVTKSSKYDKFAEMGYTDPVALDKKLKEKDSTINNLSSDLEKERTAKTNAEKDLVDARKAVDEVNSKYLTAQATVDIVKKVGIEKFGMTEASFKSEEAYEAALKGLSKSGNVSEMSTSELFGEIGRRILGALDLSKK